MAFRKTSVLVGVLVMGAFVLYFLHVYLCVQSADPTIATISSSHNSPADIVNCQLCMKGGENKWGWGSPSSRQFKERFVHLDLKGGPPRMKYLLQLLPLFRKLGATGLLVEYEDMYPYEGQLAVLKRKDAYTNEEIREFIKQTESNGLLVVPLVQTFGHLEFVLKHDQFKKIRATPDDFFALCPSNKDSLAIVKMIINDIMRLHPRSKWIHLGGDEVYGLGSCELDKKSGLNKRQLYLHHMQPILEFVRDKFPGLRSLIWHDMLKDWPAEDLKKIASLVEPMIWEYRPHVYEFVSGEMLKRFSSVFPRIWAASAFKGASGPIRDYVPISERLQNHVSWSRILQEFPGPGQLVGIALTGWSRYDHFATYCELLPSGIPSLGVCLAALQSGYLSNANHETVSAQLGLQQLIPLDEQDCRKFNDESVRNGSAFPGSDVYSMSISLLKLRLTVQYAFEIDHAWSSLWNTEHKLVNSQRLVKSRQYLTNAMLTYKDIESIAGDILRKYYDDQTVEEFKISKLKGVSQQIQLTVKSLEEKITRWKQNKL